MHHTRAAILRHVRANPGVEPKDIANARPEVEADTVHRTCSRMATDGQLAVELSGLSGRMTHAERAGEV